MKKIAIIFLCSPFFINAQNSNLTFDQANDIKYVKKYKNNTTISSYTTKDGFTINIGDTLTIGNAVIERKRYMLNDVFSHIVIGKTKGVTNKEFRYLPHNYSGTKVIVQSLFVTHEKFTGYKLWPNRKEMPLYVSIFVKNPKVAVNSVKGFSKMLSHSRKTILDIEKALSSGEIINPNSPLSREEAIKKLKESKDKIKVITVRATAFEEAENVQSSAEIIKTNHLAHLDQKITHVHEDVEKLGGKIDKIYWVVITTVGAVGLVFIETLLGML